MFGKKTSDASTGGGYYKGYERSLMDDEEKVLPVRNADVAVFSLLHGRGCTHTAAALANWLSEDEENKMVFFTDELMTATARDEYLVGGIKVLPREQRETEARHFSSVVEDIGVIGDVEVLPAARTLVCVCSTDEKYMSELARFAKNTKQSKDVVYIFNNAAKKNDVVDAMVRYRVAGFINECYPADEPTHKVKVMFKKILEE